MLFALLCIAALLGFGAFFLSAALLRLPTSASTRAVITVRSRQKRRPKKPDAVILDMAVRVSKIIRLTDFKKKRMEATLKSADIALTPETYTAQAIVRLVWQDC